MTPRPTSSRRSCASASSRRARCRDPRGIIGWYGHENDAPSPDDPVRPLMVPAAGGTTEAQKTEPDKNTYLGAHGAEERRPGRRLRHPLPVPGHEAAAKDVQGRDLGDITRINRDADTARRVALMAWKHVDGAKLATIDGSTWDPFAQRLLFTTEDPGAPTYAATVGSPRRWRTSPIARPRRLRGHPERQGPERLDRRGPERPQQGRHEGQAAEQLHLPLRAGEPGRPGARQAAALQVLNRSGQPITFASQAALNAPDQVLLHSYGVTLSTRWVTVHDTAVDGTTPFDANGAAKAANATSLKRPENGVLRPGSHTQRDGLDSGYVFDTTGTTRRARSRSGGSRRAATRRRRSTRPTTAWARTTATTRSPASTSPAATRARKGSSAHTRRTSSTAGGAGSGPPSTATTTPTR